MPKMKFKPLIVVLPPLVLIGIGIAVYISVIKLTTPPVKTVSALPNSTSATESATPTSQAPASMQLTQINTQVTTHTKEQIEEWQSRADSGQDSWRLDVMRAAEQMAGQYGFLPGDQLTLNQSDEESVQSGQAEIMAIRQSDVYVITLIQPGVQGSKGIWVISSIEKQEN